MKKSGEITVLMAVRMAILSLRNAMDDADLNRASKTGLSDSSKRFRQRSFDIAVALNKAVVTRLFKTRHYKP